MSVMGGYGHQGRKCIRLSGVGYYPKEKPTPYSRYNCSGDLMTNVGVSYKFGENKTLGPRFPHPITH